MHSSSAATVAVPAGANAVATAMSNPLDIIDQHPGKADPNYWFDFYAQLISDAATKVKQKAMPVCVNSGYNGHNTSSGVQIQNAETKNDSAKVNAKANATLIRRHSLVHFRGFVSNQFNPELCLTKFTVAHNGGNDGGDNNGNGNNTAANADTDTDTAVAAAAAPAQIYSGMYRESNDLPANATTIPAEPINENSFQRTPMLLTSVPNESTWMQSLLLRNSAAAEPHPTRSPIPSRSSKTVKAVAKFYAHSEKLSISDVVDIYGVWCPPPSKTSDRNEYDSVDSKTDVEDDTRTPSPTKNANGADEKEDGDAVAVADSAPHLLLPVIHVLYYRNITKEPLSNPILALAATANPSGIQTPTSSLECITNLIATFSLSLSPSPSANPNRTQFIKCTGPDFELIVANYRAQITRIRGSLLHYIGQHILGGASESVVAKYILLNMISSRISPKLLIGYFALNIRGFPQQPNNNSSRNLYQDIAHNIRGLYALLLPCALNINLSIQALNHALFVPVKNHETQELELNDPQISVNLQIANNTNVVLNETTLQTGKLNAVGVKNCAALKELIMEQKVTYDFKFHGLTFQTSAAVLLLSVNKPLKAYFDPNVDRAHWCSIYLKNAESVSNQHNNKNNNRASRLSAVAEEEDEAEAEEEEAEEAETENGCAAAAGTIDGDTNGRRREMFLNANQDLVREWRVYLCLARMALKEFSLDQQLRETIENDFVEYKQENPKQCNYSDLHHRLNLLRLLNASWLNGKSVTLPVFEEMKALEKSRLVRNHEIEARK